MSEKGFDKSMIKNRKLINKFVALMLSMALAIGFTTSVYADGLDDLGKIVDGSKLTNEEVSEVIIDTLVRGNILNQGVARISNNGNGSVNIYGAVLGLSLIHICRGHNGGIGGIPAGCRNNTVQSQIYLYGYRTAAPLFLLLSCRTESGTERHIRAYRIHPSENRP